MGGKDTFLCTVVQVPMLFRSSTHTEKTFASLQEYDATCLISKFNNLSATILIDQVEGSYIYLYLPSNWSDVMTINFSHIQFLLFRQLQDIVESIDTIWSPF